MENTEVMKVEEIEVMEPVVTEVAEATTDNSSGAKVGFVVGTLAVAGGMLLWKFAIKPTAKKIKAKIEQQKKLEQSLSSVRSVDDTQVTTVDFEEVENSDDE